MEKQYYFNAGIPPPLHFQPSLSPLQMPNNFCNPNFEKSTEQYSQFESALSSMVTSPAASNSATDPFAIRELIGKLGSICNASQISPELMQGTPYISGGNNSPNTSSCYNTTLGSPPKLHVPVMNHFVTENLPNLGNPIPMNFALPVLSTDPGFAERAAKFSCFGSRSFNGRKSQIGMNNAEFQYRSSGLLMENGNVTRVASSPSLKAAQSPMGIQENKNNSVQTQMEMRSSNGSVSASGRKFSTLSGSAANSTEESSVSGQNPSGENGLRTPNELDSRKRKGVSRGKAKETAKKKAEGDDDSSAKRSKMTGSNNGGFKTEEESNRAGSDEDQKQANNYQKPAEPPKDYIHVRARRGQATDSHSLAERVRREKIGERMKLLQDLVPGCNKVTGKALMLDEIINYVKSLQRQVEFLSMKLATLNLRLDINMESLLSKDMFQPNGTTMPHQIYPVDASAPAYQGHQNPQVHKSVEPLDAALCRNLSMPLDGFGEGLLTQFSAFFEDDLQSIVEMGIAPNQTSHMKIEL